MASPSEKLAVSMDILKKALGNTNSSVVRSNLLTRTHRERLVANGFLTEILKGWYILTRPEEKEGDSTSWYTSYWQFCSIYLNSKFDGEWIVSPEQSILIHSDNWTIPDQLFIHSPKGSNNIVKLPYNTSVFDLKTSIPPKDQIIVKDSIPLLPISLALINITEKFFKQHPVDARAALLTIKDASEILAPLLDGSHSVIAGRLAGAFRNIGRDEIADDILGTMKAAGFDVREKDPFTEQSPDLRYQRNLSPYVYRIQQLYQKMRGDILLNLSFPKTQIVDAMAYLKEIDDVYKNDAYNSLSIEGYQITPELIERVKSGNWNPDKRSEDEKDKNAMAARGYWLAFSSVKESVNKVLKGTNAGKVAETDHRLWYRELLSPSVSIGILKPSDLAGYRNSQVYIRNSKHVPLNPDAVIDVMPEFFRLLIDESEPIIRSVLGHFLFVYIHPYNDGNGRIARFLMNIMLASGGYSWTVIPLKDRDRYMSCLEEASVKSNIIPFAKFIIEHVSQAN